MSRSVSMGEGKGSGKGIDIVFLKLIPHEPYARQDATATNCSPSFVFHSPINIWSESRYILVKLCLFQGPWHDEHLNHFYPRVIGSNLGRDTPAPLRIIEAYLQK